MLKQYEELLATLKRASDQARAMQLKGAPTDRVYRGLAAPIKEVETRIGHIRGVEARNEREAELAKAEAAKAEPAENAEASTGPEATAAKPQAQRNGRAATRQS